MLACSPGGPSGAPTSTPAGHSTLFAALEISAGHASVRAYKLRTGTEFLALRKQVARGYPEQ